MPKTTTKDQPTRIKKIIDPWNRSWRTKNQNGEKVLNFLDCANKYLGDKGEKWMVNRRWNNKTNNDYIKNYYESRILRYIDSEKSISDFTDEDVDDFVFAIESAPEEADKKTIGSRCRQLFWDVYEAGFKHGEYEDQLFWKRRGMLSDEEDDNSLNNKRKNRQLSRKSLEVREEVALFNHFINVNPRVEDGRTYGAMLMFSLGLRNNEAAGASFENIVRVPDKDFYALYVIKTTVWDTNELKFGGKTYNAARILPLVPFLKDLLFERLKAITGKESIEEAMKIGGHYPIACRGTDFTTRCTRSDITSKARELFKMYGILDRDVYTEAALSEILRDKLLANDIGEKNVTAYLLRRGTATHLYCLGLSPSQIQYFIGHEVEDQNELRNYFTNPDRLEELYRILLKHPFCTLFRKRKADTVLTIKAHIRTYVRITADEPNQSVKLRNNTPKEISITQSDAPLESGYRKYIDISSKTDDVYLNAVAELSVTQANA